MKKRLTYSMLAIMVLAGCQVKELETEKQELLPAQDSKPFVAIIENDGNGSETKTTLDNSGNVLWKQGDQVSIFAGSTVNECYQVTAESEGKTSASLNKISGSGSGSALDNNVAFYPYSSTATIAKSGSNYVISGIELPATQNYAEDSFGNGAFSMAAITSTTAEMNITFKNVLGGLKLQLKGTATIASITVTGNNNEILCGDAEVTVSTESTPSINLTEASAKTVTLDCGAGVALDSETATSFIIALPPMTMTGGFTVVVTDTEGKEMEIKSTRSQTITRSSLLKMPAVIYVGTSPKKALLPQEYLPNGIDKTTITEVHFHVSNPKTTATIISAGDSEYEPIYLEKEGTAIHYYTVGKAFVPYSCFRFFNGWNSLETLDLSMWDTSNTISMREMFRDCYALRAVNLSSFDTESVNDMSLMFHNCWNLESIDLSSFNTSNVSNMSNMFSCFIEGGGVVSSALRQIDLSMFNTSNVTDVNQMFSGCRTLESINLTGWDTKNVEDMSSMFQECRSLKSIDLSSFDTGNVFGMSWMFAGCENLTELDLSNFNTSNVKYFTSMFSGCQSLTRLDISSFTLESMVRVDQMLHGCVKMLQLNMSAFDVPISFVETDFCTSLAGKSKSCAVKCCDSAKQLIQDNYDYKSNYFIWVALNDNFPANTEVRDPNLYYSSDYSKHQTIETLQTASYGNGINIAIMGDQYSDRLIADGTYKKDMQTAIEGIFELEPYKTYRDYFNIKMVYLVSETEVCYSEGGSTALDVTNGLSNTIQANTYALSAFPGSDSQETAVIVICHDLHSFDGSGALGYTFTQYLPENNSFANDYGQAAQAVCWIPVYDDEEVFKSTVSHEFGHCFAKLFDEYEVNTGTPDEAVINNQKQTMSLFGVGKNIDFTSDPYLIKWNNFLNDPRYVNSGIGIFEGGYIGSSGVWRPSDDSIMRSADYGTVFNAPSREAIYYRIHKLAFGESWEYDYEAFVQQDIKNVPQASPAPAKHTSSSVKVNRKHFFKMEESISEDGKKIITIIQN